jgi:hypothetical protein
MLEMQKSKSQKTNKLQNQKHKVSNTLFVILSIGIWNLFGA